MCVRSYPCIIRYILNCDKSAPKCPVCAKHICQPDLKAVKIKDAVTLHDDSSISLQLCSLQHDSMFPVLMSKPHAADSVRHNYKSHPPRDPAQSHHNPHHNHHHHHHHHQSADFEELTGNGVPFFHSVHSKFSRVCVATVDDVRTIFAEERAQLLAYQADCLLTGNGGYCSEIRGDVEHIPYINIALEYSSDREAALIVQIAQCLEMHTKTVPHTNNNNGGGGSPKLSRLNTPTTPSSSMAALSASTTLLAAGTQQQPPSSSSSRDSVESVVMTPHTTYFYQLANGQHVYLHPLCVRMLIAAAEETSHLRRRRNSNRSDSGDSGTSASAGDGGGPAAVGGGVGNVSSDGDEFGHNDGDDLIAPASGAVDAAVEIGSGAPKRKSKSRQRPKADDYQLELTTAVTANIVEIEVCKLTTELRQRVPFLRHLSLGTTVTLLELDVKDMVPHSILPKFKDELHGREKKRMYRVQEKLRELELDEEQK
jgi:hypothetical protein